MEQRLVMIIPEAIDMAFTLSKPTACLQFLFAVAVQELIEPTRSRPKKDHFAIGAGVVPNVFDPTQGIHLAFKPTEHTVNGVPRCHWNIWLYINEQFAAHYPGEKDMWKEHGFAFTKEDEVKKDWQPDNDNMRSRKRIQDDWMLDISDMSVVNTNTSEEVLALMKSAE